jgi:hypothetical protein
VLTAITSPLLESKASCEPVVGVSALTAADVDPATWVHPLDVNSQVCSEGTGAGVGQDVGTPLDGDGAGDGPGTLCIGGWLDGVAPLTAAGAPGDTEPVELPADPPEPPTTPTHAMPLPWLACWGSPTRSTPPSGGSSLIRAQDSLPGDGPVHVDHDEPLHDQVSASVDPAATPPNITVAPLVESYAIAAPLRAEG